MSTPLAPPRTAHTHLPAWQEDGTTWLPVYKTETKRDNLSPTWDVIKVQATQLNNGDSYRPLKIEVRALLKGCRRTGAWRRCRA